MNKTINLETHDLWCEFCYAYQSATLDPNGGDVTCDECNSLITGIQEKPHVKED